MTGEQIKTFRENLKLTQEQLAHLMGVSFATINRWENGHNKPHPVFIDKLKSLKLEG